MITSLKDGPVGAFALALVATIGVIVLVATNHPVPTELWALDTALIGGGLGITNPTSSSSSSAPASSSSASSSSIDQAAGQ